MDDVSLLRQLEPVVEQLMERHLATTREWFPHQHVPYGRGRDFVDGQEWCVDAADLGGSVIDDAVRSSLIVNLLTEDNLPYYFRTIERALGADGAWGAWSKRWTAEEGRHSMAIYGYLMVTRAVDPVALERCRMHQVSTGQVPEPSTPMDVLVYVALQELATRIAHRNTGRLLGDSAGYDVMMRVAADENLHHLFYRDLTSAAIELDPSSAVCAIERQVVGFEMPGAGIPGFVEHAAAISRAGIYDLTIHHDQILAPVILNRWAVESLTGLDAEAELARDRLMARLAKSERVARRLSERRARDGCRVMSAGDQLAVAQTIYRYAIGIDTKDFDLYRSIFADEVAIDFTSYSDGVAAVMTAEQWVANVRPLFTGLAATQHSMTNPLPVIDGDTAACRMYMQAHHVYRPEDPASWFTIGGYYDDTLVRSASGPAGWLLTGVTLTVLWRTGDPSIMARAAADGRSLPSEP